MEVDVGSGDLHGLVPDQRVGPEQRLPVELDVGRLARVVDQPERVHAEALHHPIAARQRPVRHDPHHHVRRLGHQRDEIPERVVCRRSLRHPVMRLGLHRMDQVRELDRVLDEEHRDVVADDVPVAFVGIELDREAAHIARGVHRTALAGDRREAHERRRDLAGGLERRGLRHIGHRLVALKEAVGPRSTRMNDPLGNALVVEVRDLLAQVEVLEERRSAQPGLQRVLVVADRHAHVGRQHLPTAVDADARKRSIVAVVAVLDRRGTDLRRDVGLAQRAGRDLRRRLDVLPLGRRIAAVALVLERLVVIERHRSDDGLDRSGLLHVRVVGRRLGGRRRCRCCGRQPCWSSPSTRRSWRG